MNPLDCNRDAVSKFFALYKAAPTPIKRIVDGMLAAAVIAKDPDDLDAIETTILDALTPEPVEPQTMENA